MDIISITKNILDQDIIDTLNQIIYYLFYT
jgi:hypothetical protein